MASVTALPKQIVRRSLWLAAQVPLLRPAVLGYYDRKRSENGWSRLHPFDRAHGVRTSGALPGFVLRPGDPLDAPTTAYGASQPSTIRAALGTIPAPDRCAFLDLGCGKGRALLVASELPFRAITGVELSPELAAIAAGNAAVIARAHPERTRIDIIPGDALSQPLPDGDIVVFLYHPFDRPHVARLRAIIEAALLAARRRLYLVYCNPVWAEIIDASAALERRFAAQRPYAADEIGFGPQDSEAVVIWQDRGNPHPRPPGSPDAPVVIRSPGLLAEVIGEPRS